jgi:nucleotide-binding universal stress UspA family protein
MPHSVLIATDFSVSSTAALEQGRWLSERLGAYPEILHVVENHGTEPWHRDPAVELWISAAGLSVSSIVTRSGTPWVEIVRRAQDIGAVLLVVGSHGQSGFHPLRLGSTAERLGSAAPCPIVIVSSRAAPQASRETRAALSQHRP